MELIDLTGQRFGKLTVIERAPDKILPSGKRSVMWRCRCDCGNIKIADGSSLRRGETKTCGCWKKPKTTHGMPTQWVKMPKPLTIQDKLIIGETYTIRNKRLRLVSLHQGYARFEDESGYTTGHCYHYWDLERWIK